VLLVPAVEESANMTLPAEIASAELDGMLAGFHRLPRSFRNPLRLCDA
jgi:hypothetical protein